MISQAFDQGTAFIFLSKYVLLGLGTFFEGSGAMLSGGYLWRLGAVSFVSLYLTLLVADVASDIAWYTIGYFGARKLMLKYGKYVNVTPEIVDKLEIKFKQNQMKILTISKLSMGLGFAVATLATAGMLRVNFMKYLIINTLGSLVWVLFLILLGYAVGNVLAAIPIVYQLIFAAVMIVGILFLFKYLVSLVAEKK